MIPALEEAYQDRLARSRRVSDALDGIETDVDEILATPLPEVARAEAAIEVAVPGIRIAPGEEERRNRNPGATLYDGRLTVFAYGRTDQEATRVLGAVRRELNSSAGYPRLPADEGVIKFQQFTGDSASLFRSELQCWERSGQVVLTYVAYKEV